MKIATALLFFVITVDAQVVPTTPTKFGTRGLGGLSSSNGSTSASAGASATKALCAARQWTSADGKPLLAKLIAMEDIVVESQGQPTAPAVAPTLPGKPTVVRGNSVRLFVNNKPALVPLDRLSQADRDFIAKIQQAIAATPVPATATK
jgi:hypothetical protein